MFAKQINVIQLYLDPYFLQRFTLASSTFYFLPVLFVITPEEKIRFCIYYMRLNAITKPDYYLIPLIEKIFTQLKG